MLETNKMKASKLHSEAQELSDSGNDAEAIAKYLEAVELDPTRSECFYNIGLIYKYQKKWLESLSYNLKASELSPDDEATLWNLGIAATALRKWELARKIWHKVGIKLDENSGPINMNFGATPVRLNPDTTGEVVWATRIDPVRARIENIPYIESGYKYQDIVLHDGAAVGYRKLGDRECPVFNVFEIYEISQFRTLIHQTFLWVAEAV